MDELFDVIVIGGGAIGMTSAWRIAQTGRRVLLLERGQLGGEASSAAAGMLGAQLEVSEPGPFYQLCLESRSLYENFVNELYEITGIDAQLMHNGIFQLAYSETEAQALHERMKWQTAGGANAEWIDSQSVAEQEPVLSGCLGALLLPDDSNVNARLLTRSLGVAVHRTCTVHEGIHVTDIQPLSGGGYTVMTATNSYIGESVVVAAGAWAERLLQPFSTPCTIRPVKGQLLTIRPRHGQRLRRTVFNDHVYLVPKRDGTIVVGATEERDSGFNRDVTIDSLMSLLFAAQRIAPGLHDAVFEQSWTGLRPGSPNGQPWIGEIPEYPGLHVAVGHFRNGILLSPVTGNMVTQSVKGEPWPERWQPFHVILQSEVC
ncbi:glycine oxidase ThiO [Alicyclobacillus dauci]|uniref:glycine oxidase n=1 Tax=Alicyclobacillus dauci TaxID=1475485 RepID=A0ABY6Z3Q7_9BACL|nr:glycine oxidase ThiO [Alicyclobacillus dauci]WAH36966.1 glycine oxidase ThiO [Alicyclobacillus dauci]